ncbi:YoaP domain-containing protein [Janthinobacterium fluminis]|uniref:YoaP domain-containing protein n=1 Tax=Janthinobacterium fluminis TaxID=2987524 RepID=A0ABT5JVF7_9BURK|nr:YoaP domain-containing protein [Janthinobacterium fluminis]MDC8756708.1 YoaP domain-containing protein [Janthinobacterium fluminis]
MLPVEYCYSCQGAAAMTDSRIIEIHPGNIAMEHICCALADAKCADGYAAKKRWLAQQHAGGYRFQRLDARGKVFIEYVPAEQAWLPLDASGYMVVNCFWVSGRFKMQGHGRRLLQRVITDAAAMHGLVAVTGEKKRPYMSDPAYFEKQGFACVDTAPPYFRLWCKKLKPDAPTPQFKQSAKAGCIPGSKGIVAYYTNTCPFTESWTGTALRDFAERRGIPCAIHRVTSQQEAHALPIPWIINSVFYDGELVTLELDSVKRLEALLAA